MSLPDFDDSGPAVPQRIDASADRLLTARAHALHAAIAEAAVGAVAGLAADDRREIARRRRVIVRAELFEAWLLRPPGATTMTYGPDQ